MKLKEIKPGMVIHCKTQEEANQLCNEVGASYRWKEYWEVYKNRTCYEFNIYGKLCSYGSMTYFIKEKYQITEFSDLIIPEISAEEVLKWISEHYRDAEWIELFGRNYCMDEIVKRFGADYVVLKISKWKSDHAKKEPEIETVDVCRIIKVLPDRKMVVHEEDIRSELPFGGDERQMVEEILKKYCMEHEGKFIAVHDVVSRVKEVS